MPGITINLTDRENASVQELASFHEMNPNQVIKQAIAMLVLVDSRSRAGDRMAFVDNNGTLIKEKLPGLGG